MARTQSNKTLLRRQPPMRRVLVAMVPCLAGAVVVFGWRSLAMVGFCAGLGIAAEWLFCRRRGQPVSEAVLVTTTLFALALPPGVAWHVQAVGVVFAVVVAKEVFGGFGRNVFNPALAGRCFVYICFPAAMTSQWAMPVQGPLGGLARWSATAGTDGTEAVTGATPMANLKSGALRLVSPDGGQTLRAAIPWQIAGGEQADVAYGTAANDLLWGRIPGSMGVTSAVLILIGGLYLFVTRTASRTTILSVVLSYAVLTQTLHWAGVGRVPPGWIAVLGGGFFLGAFFMATDPVSSPRTEGARVLYGILIGTATVVIRNFSVFNGGLMFAILLGNMFAPILDVAVSAWGRSKANRARGVETAT